MSAKHLRGRGSALQQRIWPISLRMAAGDHGGKGLVPGGDDDAIARPRQPRAPQVRLSSPNCAALPPVTLEPQARLGHLRTKDAAVATGVHGIGERDRAPRRALGARITHRNELAVTDVGSDVALRALDPLLDLVEIGVEERIARRRRASLGP